MKAPGTPTAKEIAARIEGYPFLRRTGQMWKWRLGLGLGCAGVGCIFVAHQFWGRAWAIPLDLAGVVIAFGGFTWWAWSLKCPRCGARPWLRRFNGKGGGPAMEACPRCGFTPSSPEP